MKMRETQFQTRGDSPYTPREMRSDSIIEAEYERHPFLIHIEWQSDQDNKMDERLLGYSYEATRLHSLNVHSAVIYLQTAGNVPQAPLDRVLPYGRRMLGCDFDSLKLYEQEVETFRRLNLDAFYALMLLCKDGATHEVLEEVLAHLEKRNRKELISITRFFAGKIFTSGADRERLERRFAMLREFIKDSWTFQQTLEEGRVEGRIEGRVEGRWEGHVEELRLNIEGFVAEFFPDLLTWTRAQIWHITDLEMLRKMLRSVARATSEDEIRQVLSA